MININSLTEDDKGRKVIYHREHCKQEEGELSSWNDKYIFVKFKGPNGEACEPNDVSFIDCEHEWEIVDESYDHEYGYEQIVYEMCYKCFTKRDYESQRFDDDVI